MTKDIEREAFEATQNTKVLFEAIEYIELTDAYMPKNGFGHSLVVSSLAERLNFGWKMWQAAKANEAKKLEGCVVVPVEPTDLMINTYRDNSVAPVSTLSVTGYKAMIEAARVEMSNWISVKDRLPSFRVPVFAGFYRDGDFIWWIFERYDEDEGWGWARYEGDLESDAYADEYEITHWQPLLEEPKADAEGNQ